jgi:hypothetical protein
VSPFWAALPFMRDREWTTALGALEKRSEYVAVAMTIK